MRFQDLALSVEPGQPNRVTLDWIAYRADGSELECKLVLECTLALNSAEECRELTVHSVGGDAEAVTEFGLWATRHRGMVELDDTGVWLEDDRMTDVAEALEDMPDLRHQYPRLLCKVVQ